MDLYARAISNIESGSPDGNYATVGPPTRRGDRAYGRYQVMGNNIPDWTQAALGRSMSPDEFLADKGAQDAVFRHRFGGYADKYGPQGAANMWFTGRANPPASANDGYTSAPEYLKRFNAGLGDQGSTSMAYDAPTQQPSAPGTALAPPAQFTPGARGPGTVAPASPSNWFGTGMPNGISGNFMGGLGDVGLAMIAMGDPKAAAAIGTLQKQAAAGEYEMHYDPASGSIIRTNKRTGAVDVVKNSLQTKEPSKVDSSVLKDLASTNTSYSNIFNSAHTASELKDMLDSGKIDPSLLGMTQAQIENLRGKASPEAQALNKLQAFRNTLASDQLRLNTGTQTDKDFQVAKESLVSGLGSFDPKTMSAALDAYINRTRDTAHKAYGAQLQSYRANYPDAPVGVFAPYDSAHEEQRKFYEGYGQRKPATPSAPPPPLHSFKR